MSHTSLVLVKCLCRKNTNTSMIRWLRICIGAYVGSVDLNSTNVTNTHQRMESKVTKSRFYVIERKNKQENDSSMWLSLVIIISRSKKSESLQVNWPSESSCQNVGNVEAIIVQIMIGKLGYIQLDLKTYIKEIGINPTISLLSFANILKMVLLVWGHMSWQRTQTSQDLQLKTQNRAEEMIILIIKKNLR